MCPCGMNRYSPCRICFRSWCLLDTSPRPAKQIVATIVGTSSESYPTSTKQRQSIILHSGEISYSTAKWWQLVQVSKFVPVSHVRIRRNCAVVWLVCGWVVHGEMLSHSCCDILAAVHRHPSNPTTKPNPPSDIFGLYLILPSAAILQLGGVLFDHSVSAAPLPPTIVMIAPGDFKHYRRPECQRRNLNSFLSVCRASLDSLRAIKFLRKLTLRFED